MANFPPSTKLDTPSEIRRKLRENVTIYDPMGVDEKLDYLLDKVEVISGTTTLFKTYSVFVSQSGTTAPTVVSLLEDTIGSPVWTRVTGGTYLLTKTGAFIANSTKPFKAWGVDKLGNGFEMNWTSVNTLTLYTYASTDLLTPVDDILDNTEINVYVYGSI
jgi:hypothetical protein